MGRRRGGGGGIREVKLPSLITVKIITIGEEETNARGNGARNKEVPRTFTRKRLAGDGEGGEKRGTGGEVGQRKIGAANKAY